MACMTYLVAYIGFISLLGFVTGCVIYWVVFSTHEHLTNERAQRKALQERIDKLRRK